MEIFAQAVAGLLTLGVGSLAGWVWSISSKVTILETKEPGLKEILDVKFENLDQRLGRIERALNGSLRNHYQD